MSMSERPESTARNRVVAVIPDFTLGIYSDIFQGFASTAAASTIARNGAATIESTFRCGCDPVTGALIPLPRGQDGYSKTLIPGNANVSTSYYPSNLGPADFLLDMVAVGPAKTTTSAEEVIFVLYGANIAPNGDGDGHYRAYVLGSRILQVAQTSLDFSFRKGDEDQVVAQCAIPSANIVSTRHLPSATDPASANIADFVSTVADVAAYLLADWYTGAVAAPETGWTNYDTWAANYEDDPTGSASAWFYPDVKNTNSHDELGFTESYGFILEAHQGRVVLGGRFHNTMDADVDSIVEFISYTPVFNIQNAGGAFYAPTDPPSPYCAMGSMTADELFLVKAHGGAILIRGDLNGDYQLVKLPFVQPTNGVHCHATTSPVGLAYLTRRGVFAWSGGDTAEQLSPQLDGLFWEISTSYIGSVGTLCYQFPYLLVPNSYAFDTRTKSWWRLEDTTQITPFNCYTTSPQSERFYAGKWKKTASDNVLYRYYDPTTLAYTYSWQSQPLVESWEYRLEAREIEIIAQPHASSSVSTVVVTVSAFDEDGDAVTPVSVTFTLDATNKRPQRLRKQLSISGAYMRIKIVADGTSAPAPQVYGPLRIIGQVIAKSPIAT